MDASTTSPAAWPLPAPSILLADADPVTCVLLTRLLQRLGYPPAVQARDGDAAREAASTAACDVILLDADLPPTGGSALARELAHSLGPRRPWVILMSTACQRPQPAAAIEGVDAHLDKPLRLGDLTQCLAAASNGRDFNVATWIEWLRLFGPKGAAEMVAALIRDDAGLQGRLRAATLAADALELKRFAHGLRGACLQLGASVLASLCEQAEQAATEGHVAQASQLSAQALARYRRLVTRLQDEIRRI